jgi:hypothetical protein
MKQQQAPILGSSPEAYALAVNHQELADLRTALAEYILDSHIPMNTLDRDRAADQVKLLFRMDRMDRMIRKAAKVIVQ